MTKRTVIVGCGNGLCGDDAVGLAVARFLVEEVCLPPDVAVVVAGTPGVGLLDMLQGFRRAIIIDAVLSGGESGEVYRFGLQELEETTPITSLHGFSVAEVLALGKVLEPEGLPEQIEFVGVEVSSANLGFADNLSPAVRDAVSKAVAMTLTILGEA